MKEKLVRIKQNRLASTAIAFQMALLDCKLINQNAMALSKRQNFFRGKLVSDFPLYAPIKPAHAISYDHTLKRCDIDIPHIDTASRTSDPAYRRFFEFAGNMFKLLVQNKECISRIIKTDEFVKSL